MKIQSVDLPGIGKKYTIRSAEGQVFVIIIHLTGRREIYFMNDPDDDEPVMTLDLNDEEARKVGAILLGADYQPVSEDRMELLMKTLLVEWIKVKPGCAVANKNIKEARVRTLTGATIIAIQRQDRMIGSPDIQELLLPGDVIMAVGKREQIKALESMCKGQVG